MTKKVINIKHNTTSIPKFLLDSNNVEIINGINSTIISLNNSNELLESDMDELELDNSNDSNIRAVKTYTIGYQGPLTGPEASLGIDEQNAIKYAIKLFEAKNKNIKINLVSIDDQGDPAVAVTVVPGAVSDKKILGIVGPAYSGATIASLQYYKPVGMALISPSATRVSLTAPADGIIGFPVFHRVVSTDKEQGPLLFKLATKGVSSPKVFIVDDKSIYGVSLVNYMKPTIPAGQSAGFDSVSANINDLSATIAKVKTTGANVVIYIGYFSQAALFFKQLRDSGYKGILAGSDGVFSPSLLTLVPASVLEGARFTSGSVTLADIDAKLEADFKKKMGVSSGVYAIESINATNVLLNCIAKGATTRDAMLKAVKAYSGKSLTGSTIKFDIYGDVVGGIIYGMEVKGGVFKFTGQINN